MLGVIQSLDAPSIAPPRRKHGLPDRAFVNRTLTAAPPPLQNPTPEESDLASIEETI